MKKLFVYLKKTSLFFRLSIIIIVTFTMMLGLFLFASNNYRLNKQASAYAAVNSNNLQALSKIDDYIRDISNITKLPLTYKQLDAVYMNYLYDFTVNGSNCYQFQLLNEQIFNEIFTYKKTVNSCFIFNLEGAGDYKVVNAIYQPFNPSEEPWFTDCINAFGKPVVIDTYELPSVVNERLRPLYVFGIARGIVQLKDASVIGILLVNTDISYFEEICNDIKLTDHHRIIILHDDSTVYDTVSENIACTAESTLLTIPDNTDENIFSLTVDGETMLASSVSSDFTGWRIISLIPESELFSEINHIQRQNTILIVFVMTATLILFFFLLTKQIVHPIQRLCSVMKIAESGDFSTHIQVDGTNEINQLSASYNSLLDKINELIQESYVQQITASELKLQALQSQINPHFLYNTLESISMMATINDDDAAADMAASLGSILRYSISNMNQMVTLSDEIAQLKKYISLQEQRFRSQFSIHIHIDPKYYPTSMPKLILQPIVENAIYHGMATLRTGGLITISADSPDHNTLLLTVADNGVGMSAQQVRDLNGYINEENELFKSIGMRNVNRRIQLFCGSEYGITVESSPNEGTTVYIRIRITNN